MATEGEHITSEAFAAFDAWLRNQPEEVREMNALQQVGRYYDDMAQAELDRGRMIANQLRGLKGNAIHHIICAQGAACFSWQGNTRPFLLLRLTNSDKSLICLLCRKSREQSN